MRVAYLTFSRLKEGIAKRPRVNMIRRHATWMVIHPRSATSYLAYSYFGEVFLEAIIRCCVRCWGPFGLTQLLGGSGGRGATALPMIRGSGRSNVICKVRASLRDAHFTFYTLPARWRVLGAASRRAIASRKAVPAEVKDQTSHPFTGKTEIVCHIPPPSASEDFGKLKFCARGRRG